MVKKKEKEEPEKSKPKFPYTTEPKSLRRLLAEIPKRPKPTKITMETLKSWNVSNNNNAVTAIRVLKTIGLLGTSGEPGPDYIEFMKTGTGPTALAQHIKNTYKVLFENSLAPQNEPDDELKKLFNIHSGGGEDVMRLQVQTFKALCDYADFQQASAPAKPRAEAVGAAGSHGTGDDGQKLPPVQVDLHIHLPENKTTRDYEAIIQDIARYIYGRDIENV